MFIYLNFQPLEVFLTLTGGVSTMRRIAISADTALFDISRYRTPLYYM